MKNESVSKLEVTLAIYAVSAVLTFVIVVFIVWAV